MKACLLHIKVLYSAIIRRRVQLWYISRIKMQIGHSARMGSIGVDHWFLFIIKLVFLDTIHIPKCKIACSVTSTSQDLATGWMKSNTRMSIASCHVWRNYLHTAIDTIRCHLDSSPFMPDFQIHELVTQSWLCLHILFIGFTWLRARIRHLTQDRQKLLLLIVVKSIDALHFSFWTIKTWLALWRRNMFSLDAS